MGYSNYYLRDSIGVPNTPSIREYSTFRYNSCSASRSMTSPFQFSGSLTDVTLGDVFRLLQATGRTGCLTLICPGGSGVIYFIDGVVIEAQSSQLSGRDAIKLLAVFDQGSFEFSNETPKTRALLADSTDEFIEIIEGRALEATQIRELIPGDDQVPFYRGGSLAG